MIKIIRKKPVFYDLLFLGMIHLLVAILFRKSFSILEFNCLYPIGLGAIIGALITYIEVIINKLKQSEKYQSTDIPIICFFVITVLYVFLDKYRIWLVFMTGSYFLFLAIAFRIYEKRINKIGITWNELVPRQE